MERAGERAPRDSRADMSSSEVAPTSAEMTRTTAEATAEPVQQQDITLDMKPEVRDRVVFWSLFPTLVANARRGGYCKRSPLHPLLEPPPALLPFYPFYASYSHILVLVLPSQKMQVMQVQVPAGISPGMQFQVNIGGQIMAIACPQGAGPGSMIQIQVPAAAPAAAMQQVQVQVMMQPTLTSGVLIVRPPLSPHLLFSHIYTTSSCLPPSLS